MRALHENTRVLALGGGGGGGRVGIRVVGVVQAGRHGRAPLGGEAETGAARAVGGSIGPSKSLQSYLDLVETMGHEAKTQDRDEDGGDPFPWVAIGSDVLLGLL